MYRSPWPHVRRKRAKGKLYWYWTRVPHGSKWIALPNPHSDPDQFERQRAHLMRVSLKIDLRRREGTFGALAKLYRSSKGYLDLKPNSKTAIDRYLGRLEAAYAEAPLTEMTPEDIQVRVMDANSDTPAAADMMLSILRTLYKFALKRQRGLEDWTVGIDQYNEHTEREPWPQHVLDAALASEDDLFRLAVTLALYTGQRPGDVCAMTWNRVNGDRISVRQQKTGTHLDIPMTTDLKAALATADRKHAVILTNRRGGPLKPDVLLRWCWEHSAKFGLKLGPHGLRKNATNALFEHGCTAAEVAAVTGHRSLAMLEHYGKKRSQPRLSAVAIGKWGGTKT